MKIKVSLNTQDEWNDCWLETRYVGHKDMLCEVFIYPTVWPTIGKKEGFYLISGNQVPSLRRWIKESEDYIKQPITKETYIIHERTIAAMQKISKFLDRIFLRKYSIKSCSIS